MNAKVLSKAPEVAGSVLPDFDIRRKMDEAARRSWIEIGRRSLRVVLLVLADLAALAVTAVLVAAALWWATPLAAVDAAALVLTLLFLQPLCLGVVGAYGAGHNRVSFGRVLLGVSLSACVGWLQVQLLGGAGMAPGAPAFFGYAVGASLTIMGGRIGIDSALRAAHRRGIWQRRVLVIGSEAATAKLLRMLEEQEATEIRVVGRLSPTHRRESDALEVLSGLEGAVRSSDAWGVIVASSNLSLEALETIFRRCFELGVAVSVVPKTLHRFGTRLELRKTRAGALLRLHPKELGIPQLTIKRAMDWALSLVILLLAWPVLLAIAVAIKLDSPGPVLFRQVRAGLGGRPFGMYKFRTMVPNADEIKAQYEHLNESGDPRLFKIRNDPRVTRVGGFLRKSSLDELPQLLNVLAGDMSLIGPRPFFLDDLAGYDRHHFDRLAVLPGITGWWQVRGRSSVVDFEEVVRLDREYIERWSVWLDLKILLLTLPTVLRRRGAY
jgi:exopolysaccharide biosynthesis polyprenyl glycosylphosphotransferase